MKEMKKTTTHVHSYRISDGTSFILSHLPPRIRVSFSHNELVPSQQQEEEKAQNTMDTSTEELLDFELICQETTMEEQEVLPQLFCLSCEHDQKKTEEKEAEEEEEVEEVEEDILSIGQKVLTSTTKKIPWRCEICQKSFHLFRGRYQCNICMVFICRTCSTTAAVKRERTCLLCLQIESYEESIEQAFIRMPCLTNSQTTTKWTFYTGIPRQIYVEWLQKQFTRRKQSQVSYTLFNKKLNKQLTNQIEFERLPWRHVLHGSMWISFCRMLKETLQVDVCFMSIVDSKHELIVSSAGSGSGGGGGQQDDGQFPFTCFPRDISICNFTMANTNGLLIPNVQEDDFFCVNPMLYALQAKFYAGYPICCHGMVIGTLVVLDTKKSKQSVQVDNLHLLKTTSCAISKRMDTLVNNLQNQLNIRRLEEAIQRKQRRQQQRHSLSMLTSSNRQHPVNRTNRHSL